MLSPVLHFVLVMGLVTLLVFAGDGFVTWLRRKK
jgi:hypothetical protein